MCLWTLTHAEVLATWAFSVWRCSAGRLMQQSKYVHAKLMRRFYMLRAAQTYETVHIYSGRETPHPAYYLLFPILVLTINLD